jgi:hypothetical protein
MRISLVADAKGRRKRVSGAAMRNHAVASSIAADQASGTARRGALPKTHSRFQVPVARWIRTPVLFPVSVQCRRAAAIAEWIASARLSNRHSPESPSILTIQSPPLGMTSKKMRAIAWVSRRFCPCNQKEAEIYFARALFSTLWMAVKKRNAAS